MYRCHIGNSSDADAQNPPGDRRTPVGVKVGEIVEVGVWVRVAVGVAVRVIVGETLKVTVRVTLKVQVGEMLGEMVGEAAVPCRTSVQHMR